MFENSCLEVKARVRCFSARSSVFVLVLSPMAVYVSLVCCTTQAV